MKHLDSSEWEAYTEHVDRMILAGFSSAVRCSLQYLADNTEAAQRIAPLFEVQLVLNGNEMTYDPPLDFSYNGNFYDIMDKMVASITRMASFIPRVAKHKQFDNYQVMLSAIIRLMCLYRLMGFCLHIQLIFFISQCDIDKMADLTEMCHTVRSRTRTAIAKVKTDR